MKMIEFEYCDYENPMHLAALVDLLNHYMQDPMGECEPLNKRSQLRLVDGLANHPSSFVLFIIYDQKIAGLATCFVNFSTFNVKPYINLHDLIIYDKYRGKGLGRLLLEELIHISELRKYCKISLEVREDNRVAQNLYRSMGFKECIPNMYFWTKTIDE
nr:GNAT family N-acetyltransferase [uncultured Bacteroides sp.]